MLPIALLFAAASASAAPDPAAAVRFRAAITSWPEDAVRGISGLAQSGSMFYAVPERDRLLIPFELSARGLANKPSLALIGIPEGLDVESMAALPNDRLAFGTESKVSGRSHDKIEIAALTKDGAKVESEVDFDYGPYQMKAESNRGIEGLCFADGRLVAAAEQPIEKDGARFAALQSYDLRDKRWAQYRLRLTTPTGKISALDCRKTPSAREVFAVERHFSVSRILRFTLPLLDTGGEIHPEVLLDLTELYPKDPPNFEGLAILPDGRFLLVSDNDYGGTQGPTQLVIVAPSPPRAHEIKPGGYVQ